MCARRSYWSCWALLLALACWGPGTSWAADIETARQAIQEARAELLAFGESLTRRESDLTAREKRSMNESASLESDRAALTLERQALESDKNDYERREKALSEREASLPRTEIALAELTSSLAERSRALSKAERSRDRWRLGAILAAVAGAAGWAAFGLSLTL